MLSVLQNPPTHTYADTSFVSEIPNLIVNNLASYVDTTAGPVDLKLGASSNVVVEAARNVRMFMGNSGTLNLFNTAYNSATGVRTDTEFLSAHYAASTTTLRAPQHVSIQSGAPVTSATYSVGSLVTRQVNDKQLFDTSAPEGFWFTDQVAVDGNVTCGNHVFALGGMYANHMNVWQTRTASNLEKVGYGFNINDKDQLEIMKYTRFQPKSAGATAVSVAKRVAVFGLTAVQETDSNDTSFLAFDALNGVALSNANGTLSMISGGGGSGGGGGGTTGIASQWVDGANLSISYVTADPMQGYVGIGTSAPEYKLSVVGTIHATHDILASSDSRLKTELQRVEHAVDKVSTLTGYTYSRIDDDVPARYAGLLAQDVAAVLPEAVSEDQRGYLSVAYGSLACLFVESIKELHQRIVQLEQASAAI